MTNQPAELLPEHDAFRSAGLPTARDEPLPAHPLLGVTLLERQTCDRYLVEQVREGWWKGSYVIAQARELSSGRYISLVVSHLSCLSEDIAEEFLRFQRHFEVQEASAPAIAH